MIHLDTNYLVACLLPGSVEQAQVDAWISAGESLTLSVIAWTEFLCGSASPSQSTPVAAARALFSTPEAFLEDDAELTARLFNSTGRRRRLLADCMVAATAIRRGATLATLNLTDFRKFVPYGLQLV